MVNTSLGKWWLNRLYSTSVGVAITGVGFAFVTGLAWAQEPADEAAAAEAAEAAEAEAVAAEPAAAEEPEYDPDVEPHMEMFQSADGKPYYPSASECKQCHPDHYREWSVSPHAYGQMSPVFNSMAAKINKLTNGTNGDFCIRCHTPVGMNLSEEIFMTNIDRHPTSREGISCIVCHRVNKAFGKISGRFALNDGTIDRTIYGPKGIPNFDELFGEQIEKTLGEGTVHNTVDKFFQLTTPGFCGACHDVNLLNGFRLEEAFSDYKRGPAAKKGITCQDCHMGINPGVFTGDPLTNFETKKIAKIGADYVGEPRKKTNHMIAGPDHSVIHPGIFPHNADAAEFAVQDGPPSTGGIREWLTFDYKSGWGTEQFEEVDEPAREEAGNPTPFPERWNNIDERYRAREILDEQFALLEAYQVERLAVLRAGYQLGDIDIKRASTRGVKFVVDLRNITEGHNAPTGFDAERVVYLEVKVWDEAGKLVYQSGDRDPNWDVRDRHSLYVHNGELPFDEDLTSLQSQFITRNIRGGEREQVLAVNFSADPLPFVRPSRFASILTGNPGGARVQRRNIPPMTGRKAEYAIAKKELTGPGTYSARVRLIAGMVPTNLVDEIKDVGFDYGMSAFEVATGVRFGVGRLENVTTGEEVPRTLILEAVDAGDFHLLEDVYGKAGGQSVLQEEKFDIVVE